MGSVETPDAARPASNDRAFLLGTIALIATLALLVAVFAAGVALSNNDTAAAATGGDAAAAAAPAEPVAVALSEFAFAPASIQVTEGGSLVVTNDGQAPHNLTIRDAGMSGTLTVAAAVAAAGATAAAPAAEAHADTAVSGSDGMAGMTAEEMVANLILNDAGNIGFSLNAKSFPATKPYTLKVGQSMVMHYMNEGLGIHPMHLHGNRQLVIAKDGFPLAQPYYVDTLNVAPGERYTVLITAEQEGTWVWHCHILNHAEKPDGTMFGI